ncbi:hypothetical protein PY650_30125 [Rhizobium calliandrae]|uniref:Thioesterase n=1 Tax=Rhizobium calliandrae TaxID=1312182 RepID=A0ABT7KPD3_9HYPH|nr:hypothetical protein [Rhizobium calliandrae]MDL2409803.1 hypothetical protein [Rhizobium calliandrae]
MDDAMVSQSELQQPFPKERRHDCLGIPVLSYTRHGDPMKPLVVFVPGGGVLARIIYGHPQGRRSDFLDYWLEEQGWGLVTASYPGDHPVFLAPKPDLKLQDWASALAELVAEAIGEARWRPVIACGWSMGGKLVFALSHALRRRNLALESFVSLSATPPFPRLDGGEKPPESLLANGLWNLSLGTRDGSTRDERWLEELGAIAQAEGRTIIEPELFRDLYRTNAPPRLWGPELDPFFDGEQLQDPSDLLRVARVFSGDDYPICASIIPVDARDYIHTFSDEVVWGSITVKGLLNNVLPKLAPLRLSAHDWVRLRDRVVASPRRLTRHLPGGHYFFVGAEGARATMAHLVELRDEVQRLDAFFGTFTNSEIPCESQP